MAVPGGAMIGAIGHSLGRGWRGYALAVLGAAVAAAALQNLPRVFSGVPFAPFTIMAGLLTLYGGAGPGLLVGVLGAVFTGFVLVPPLSLWLEVGYAVVGLPAIWFIERHRRAVRALRESERRYQELCNLSNDVILHADLEGRIVSINGAISRLGDVDVERVIGRSSLDFVVPEHARRVVEHRQALLEAGGNRTGSFEVDIRNRHGETLTLDVRTGLACSEGRPIGMLAVARDVTAHRRLEAQLRQSHKLEAIGRLAGGIAHDFNNLLTAVMGFSEMTLDSLGAKHPQADGVRQVLGLCNRAAQLVKQLLAFGRRQVLQPVVLDPNEIVLGLEPMLRRLIGEDVTLVIRTDKTVGRITADPNQLTQVLLNLAVNARDAMPRGGTLTVEVLEIAAGDGERRGEATMEAGRYVGLIVSDTGNGMDATTQAHIFEPFFTTKAEGEGTGLGLATVYGIVKQSGGYIGVESEIGRGTRFEIDFPRTADPIPARPPDAPRAEPVHGTETILIAEDDGDVRALAAEGLMDLGYTVLAASDGRQAIQLAREHPEAIDLVLSDVVMPGLSGPELVAELRKIHPAARVLYMSGYAPKAEPGQSPLLDAPLVQKPFTPRGLAREVRLRLQGTTS